ncbi:MAG: hypothetical protein IPI35_20995 [Deltaproteobacteria bacterium]|nr:hypothetical protein [Deltaproteobacteria bacterium]
MGLDRLGRLLPVRAALRRGRQRAGRVAAEQAALWLPGLPPRGFYLATGERRHLDLLRVSAQRDGLRRRLDRRRRRAAWPAEHPVLGLGPRRSAWRRLRRRPRVHPPRPAPGAAGRPSSPVTGDHPRAYATSARLRSPGPVFATLGAAAGRGVVDVYTGDTPARITQDLVALSVGGGARRDGLSAQLTWVTRWDDWGEGWLAGHGPSLTLGLDRSQGFGETREGVVVGLSSDAAVFGYPPLGPHR